MSVHLGSSEVDARVDFECVPCNEFFIWDEDRRWFGCPSCGLELTLDEALELGQRAKTVWKQLLNWIKAKRSKPWRLTNLFGGKKSQGT